MFEESEIILSLLVAQLSSLPPACQSLLRLAACIGSSFDLHTLIMLSDMSGTEVRSYLLNAVRSALIRVEQRGPLVNANIVHRQSPPDPGIGSSMIDVRGDSGTAPLLIL